MHPTLKFATLCTGIVLGCLLIVWAWAGFSDLGMSGPGIAAMILGISLATALGAGLMALIFYSNRSRRDQDVYRNDGR